MALTDPIDIHAPRPRAGETGDVSRPRIAIEGRDFRTMRLYSRLAAALLAVAAILLALFVAWIYVALFDGQWQSGGTLVPLVSVGVAAALFYLKAEMRLRSYDLQLVPDAIIFVYGGRRSYVPLQHIQLFDSESSILLRLFRLRRCNLHTGGGTVVVSPVPARAASAIEQVIEEQLASMPAEQSDGG